MWFKLTYSLMGMHLSLEGDAPSRISLSSEEGEIVFWMRTFDQQNIPAELCCDAVLKRNLRPEVEDMFNSLVKGVLPQDTPPVVELPFNSFVDANGSIREKYVVPLSIMPRSFQGISREVDSKLSDLARSFIKTLRWVQGASSTQSPFGFVGFYWSTDKSSWRSMPHELSARVEQLRPIDVSPEAMDKVREVWASDDAEPLGHELIREALDIASTNPRSALLIGMSALETGLKDYVGFLVPNSDILLEKMQSPSVVDMAQQVVPALHAAMKVESSEFPLPKPGREFLKKWQSQRNQVAHGTKKTVDVEDLIRFLKFTRSLLYKLDICRGRRWAEPLASVDVDAALMAPEE